MNTNRPWLRLHIWFVVLSIVYALLVLKGFGFEYQLDIAGKTGSPWVNFLGMFVPFGPNNFILFMLPFAAITTSFQLALVMAIAVVGGIGILITYWIERAMSKFDPHPVVKVVSNIFVLFILTMLVDFLTTGGPTSLSIFINSMVK